jgi:ubiquitin-conjugating enzyme E2 J2
VIVFPSEYPFKPPGIKVKILRLRVMVILLTTFSLTKMLTPSGRFQPNKKICFSMSDYHPASVRFSSCLFKVFANMTPVEPGLECCHNVSVAFFELGFVLRFARSLTGLLSFMLSDEMTTGSMHLTFRERQVLAERSHAWNINQARFRQAFPEVSSRTDWWLN